MREQGRFHVSGRSRMTVGVLTAAALVVIGLLAVSGSATAKLSAAGHPARTAAGST